MLAWSELFVSITISLALSLGATAFIWRPLREVLARLCSSEATIRFWSAFMAVILMLGPLAVVMAAMIPSRPLIEHVRYAVLLGSLSLVGSFVFLGVVIMSHMERSPSQRDRAQPRDIASA
ncbi:MAG: hypothetical protein ACK5V0_04675 [Alphaproteobacteria bacterium]